jgi:RimJ/RimL family protein N-acetyltransferase
MVRLEPFGKNDFQQLITWIGDERLLMNWSGSLFRFPLTEESLDWYIRDTNIPGISEAFVYKVIEGETGAVIGHISLGGLSWKNRSARISRVLIGEASQQGKGFCQSMIKAVLKTGFEELGLHRIGLGVYDFNKAAIRCYEKAGMRVEGITRDTLFYNNAYWSMVEMSMLEDEWSARQAR